MRLFFQPMIGVFIVVATLAPPAHAQGNAVYLATYVEVMPNAVAPGIIKTPMHAPETYEFFAGLHPIGRMGEVSEIVDAILYLERAKFVTGETLTVDGGQHAGPGGKSHLSPRDTRLKLWPGRHDACYQARDIVQQFCVGISALAVP